MVEEIGWGVVFFFFIGCLFCDCFGSLICWVGVIFDFVYLVIGGYILFLSDLGIFLKF